jgi:arylamine N-acetyltransferase
MYRHPLLPPANDDTPLHEFLRAHGIDNKQSPLELLTSVARAFARLPFENLTKIIKETEAGRREEARRGPREVLTEHWTLGTGGTCFALTSTLLYLVRALGWQAEPILADRRYGADTHSALVVWIDSKLHLLDPGYLIVRPLSLPTDGEVVVETSFNQLILTAQDGGARIDLVTRQNKQTTFRLTYKTKPVDAGEFLRAWDASFEADMMRYPVLSRVEGEQQIYLQKQHLMIRGVNETQRTEVPPERLIAAIAEQFQLAPQIVAKALAMLHRKGESHGGAFDT